MTQYITAFLNTYIEGGSNTKVLPLQCGSKNMYNIYLD